MEGVLRDLDLVGTPAATGGMVGLGPCASALRLAGRAKQGPRDRWPCSRRTRVSKIAAGEPEGIQGAGENQRPTSIDRAARNVGERERHRRSPGGPRGSKAHFLAGHVKAQSIQGSGAAVPSACIRAAAKLTDGWRGGGSGEERQGGQSQLQRHKTRNSLASANSRPIESLSAVVAADLIKPTHAAGQSWCRGGMTP